MHMESLVRTRCALSRCATPFLSSGSMVHHLFRVQVQEAIEVGNCMHDEGVHSLIMQPNLRLFWRRYALGGGVVCVGDQTPSTLLTTLNHC